MKKIAFAFALVMLAALSGCKPKEIAPTFENPNWTLLDKADYSVSMTATIQLPAGLNPFFSESDQMVALVGDEVRGVANVADSLFFIQILGSETEVAEVRFQYWSAKSKYKYTSEKTFPFVQDQIIGTPDEPEVLMFKVVL